MGNQDLPVGFAMSMAKNEDAFSYFGSLDIDTQMQIKNYIQDCSSGDEARQKIKMSVDSLSNKNIDFLNM